MQTLLFIAALLLFTGLVIVHEWGHFIMSRRNEVDVEEFGLGFPPRAWKRKLKSGLIFSLNWLPIGGFVKLKGEHDGDTRPGSFGAASLWVKTKILLAGVSMNLIAAFVLLTVLALIGMPRLITADQFGQNQFTVKSDTRVSRQEIYAIYVEKNSPAQRAGLADLDKITSVSSNGQTIKINQADSLQRATSQFSGHEVTLDYSHNGKDLTAHVRLRSRSQILDDLYKQAGIPRAARIISVTDASDKSKVYSVKNSQDLLNLSQQLSGVPVLVKFSNGSSVTVKKVTFQAEGYLGVEPYQLVFTRSTWSAPVVAAGLIKQFTVLTFKALGHALAGLGSLIAGATTGNHQARVNGQAEATSQVGGPVAIFKILWGSGSVGYQYMLAIIALISLTLAIFNVLPIPALDGGRLFLILMSRLLLKRPLSRLAEERIVATGMALLLTLTVLITIVDVRRFF